MNTAQSDIEREAEAVNRRVKGLVALARQAGLGKPDPGLLYRVANGWGEAYHALTHLDAQLGLARWESTLSSGTYDAVHCSMMKAVRLFGGTGPYILWVFKIFDEYFRPKGTAQKSGSLPLDIDAMEAMVTHCRSWGGISEDFVATDEFAELVREAEQEMRDGDLFSLPCDAANDRAGETDPFIPET